ncbi:MAG: branched-chain amino acid ABC transporter permease [Alphaproteobacteria bacterium]|nr:branched-chain amino acid ABC transporter permease [Alphaproteobacteria bacterium]
MITQLLINTLIIGSGYALMAMAFRLMYWVSPFFNLTLGASAALGAYLGLTFGGAAWSWPIVMLAVAVFTWALEAFIYRPVREKGASPMVLLVVSLGVYTIFESVIHLIYGPQYRTLGSALDFSKIAGIPTAQFVMVVFAIVVLVAISLLLRKTFFGKEVRAIHDSPSLSDLIGLNTGRVVMIVAGIVGAILGAYGILVGFDTGMEPTMGFHLLFKGMIAAIIGGPSILGAYLGAMILAGAENLGVWLFASQWRDTVAFVIFIAMLWLRPNGIFEKVKKQ